MDFLTLFAIYVVVVLTCIVLVCKYSGQQQTPFHIAFNFVVKVLAPFTPKWLQKVSQWTLHRLFHQRNNMFIYLHILLEITVYAEFSYEVFGFCREMDTTLTRLSVPYILLVIKSFFFYLCIKRDPGTVTKKKIAVQLQIYPYDRRLFHPGISCPTCQLVKPARSKHCRVCNSLCAMAGDITLLTGDMLLYVVLQSGLLGASYIDEYGQQQPAGPLFVVQHLFLTFPRIVFMLGFVLFVFFLLAGYALFHSYLALVNQTSSEWYKSRGYVCQHCHPTTTADQLCIPAPDHSKRYYYSRGLLRNLGEIFFLSHPVKKKDT
uniref:palmitoyltransferase ZDHHC4 isoform X2 n=1 Tax=Monopterus albus TaxID=43700 RepID=UPI0009B43BAB|nr:probable palmitoyltransferase ZDHHC4 isoform X2 [Monopterus albus]